MSPELLTLTEAAELLGVSRSTVYRLVRQGTLRTVHIGVLHRVPRTALVELVDTLSSSGVNGRDG